jgi:hypothetical protein
MAFINLSNHPISSWPAAQLEAARALGLGEPADWREGMPAAAPEAGSEEIAAIAKDLADAVALTGAAGAFVATDYTLTFCLVHALQQRGILCFSATSRRETIERRRDDGSAEKVSVYRFVRWREYPRGLPGKID